MHEASCGSDGCSEKGRPSAECRRMVPLSPSGSDDGRGRCISSSDTGWKSTQKRQRSACGKLKSPRRRNQKLCTNTEKREGCGAVTTPAASTGQTRLITAISF